MAKGQLEKNSEIDRESGGPDFIKNLIEDKLHSINCQN